MKTRFFLTTFLIGFGISITTAQVLINEVMHYPSTAQGLVAGGTEYVELFNASPCLSADIGCYILGIADIDGIANNRGAIVIPSGTSIPPLGHYVIGTSSSSANPASVDFQTNNNTGNYCSIGSFLMANGDGWVGLYDATGSPVDAIYWTVSAGEASKITTDSDLDDSPCIPSAITGCTAVASLLSPKQIYQNFPAKINYVGQYTTPNTFSRIPDGGTWTRAIAPSINDATVGNCNGGTCLTPATVVFTATKTNPSCGNSNGSINVSVTASGTASYAWSANASTGNSPTASNLAAGTYSVTITQNGCSRDTTLTLNSNSTLSVTLTNPVNPTCAGNNGSITANISGGTAPYLVTIDTGGTPFTINVPFAISQTLNNLPAGTISVSVVDNASCTANTSANLIAPANCCVYSLLVNTVQPTCGNANGSITVTISNVSGTYNYAWSPNASTGNNSGAANLGAGSYHVTVTQNACSKDTIITLNSNSTLNVTLTNPVNPTCAGNNGSITANLSGGTAPYVATIDTGVTPFTINVPFAISQTLNNLPASTISVSVIDNAGCSSSASATLIVPSNCCTFILGANITQPGCGATNGSIATTTANGSGNYSYAWSANAATGNSATANNLSAAVYTLTVTDNGFANCFIDTSFTLTNPNAPVINAVNTTNETCAGTSDGTASINASGGTGNLTYTWSANASTGNSNSAINLTAGTYNFTVTDANNCKSTGNATVQSNVCCSLQTSGSSTTTTCGQNNGSATVNIINAGTLPYNYSINGAAAQASNIFSALASGSYSIVTTDNSGCKDTVTVTIAGSANSLAVTVNATDANCFGFSDGSASANASGGNLTYSYLWSTGDATSAIQNLPAGSYSITVTDVTNCTATTSAIVNQPQAVALNIGNDTVICNGNSVLLDAGSGFSSYSWNNSDTSQTISTQLQGFYQVTVTDNNGCSATDGLNINTSSGASVDLGNDITIYSGESAGIFATISGGNSGSFIWSPIDYLSCSNCLNTVASPPATTLYTLTYTDAIGCANQDSINITVLPVGEVFFPTAFSPNGDGNNDIYQAAGSGIKQFRMGIYNRWGEKVFESNNFFDGWDGYYQGTKQPMAVYVYTAKVTLLNNQTREYKGSITLLR